MVDGKQTKTGTKGVDKVLKVNLGAGPGAPGQRRNRVALVLGTCVVSRNKTKQRVV